MSTQSLEFRSGLDDSKFQAGLKNMEKGAKQSSGKISGFMKGIGIAAIGAAAMKGAQMVNNFTGTIVDNAAAAQMDTDAFQGLSGALEQSGTDMESFTRAAVTLNSSMESARTEAGPARDAFDALGISFGSIANSTPDEMIYQLADALNGAEDKGAAFNAVQDLIGKKQAKMIAALAMGGDELEKLAAKVDKISESELNSVDSVGDKVTSLIRSFKSKTSEVAAFFAPVGGETAKAPRRQFAGEDPRAIAARKDALELQKEGLKVAIETGEANVAAAQAAKEAAREALVAALSGQRAQRPSVTERRVARMINQAESPTVRNQGLAGTGGLKSGKLETGDALAMGGIFGLRSPTTNRSAMSGSGKALKAFQDAQAKNKAAEEQQKIMVDALKNIDRGINGG
jgi:hypothetical protein